jgi:hypothetical protein
MEIFSLDTIQCLYRKMYARYEGFTVVKIQVKVFWVVTPCSVVVEYQQFGGTLKMEAARSSKMLVSYCNTTWHCNSEDLD